MKKILALALVFVLLLCCGCSGETGKTGSIDELQYVIALNPSIMFEDGSIVSARNSFASSISADLSSKKTSALEKTPWSAIYLDSSDTWNNRLVRSVSQWTNGANKSSKNAPYAYKFDDNGTTSISVYDTSKMNIKGAGEIPASGIILSFTGKEEEALCYTAQADGLIQLSDRDNGKIGIVSEIEGLKTSFVDNDMAKKNLVIRVYKNNRIYWQGVLNGETTEIDFPFFETIEMKAGDSIIVTAEAVDSVDDIVVGNCDLPAKFKTITEKVANTVTVEKQTEEPAKSEIEFLDVNTSVFQIVYPVNASEDVKQLAESMASKMSQILDADVYTNSDESKDQMTDGYYILLGNTAFDESQAALKEIKNKRSNNAADFIIRMNGEKLVVAANSLIGTELAIDFFFDNYLKDDNSVVSTNLDYVSANRTKMSNVSLGGIDIKNYKIVVSK